MLTFHGEDKKLACENSRPSSLAARVLGPRAKKDGCFRRLTRSTTSKIAGEPWHLHVLSLVYMLNDVKFSIGQFFSLLKQLNLCVATELFGTSHRIG